MAWYVRWMMRRKEFEIFDGETEELYVVKTVKRDEFPMVSTYDLSRANARHGKWITCGTNKELEARSDG